MKKIFLFIIILFYGCTSQQSDENSVDKVKNETIDDRESIHHQEWEKFKDIDDESSEEYFVVNEKYADITDSSINKFRDPKFTTDGKYIIFTTHNYSQIWLHDFEQGSNMKLVDLPGCGNNFQLSKTNNEIFFRSRARNGKRSGGVYSFFRYSISSSKMEVLYKSENRLSHPLLIYDFLYFLEDGEPKNLNLKTNRIDSEFRVPFYYVENNILIKVTDKPDTINQETRALKFITCEYSDDYGFIHAMTANHGIAVFDIEGSLIKIFEEARSLDKLTGSSLVVYTDEKDDGKKITESNLILAFLNSNKTLKLSNEDHELRFNPHWAYSQNKIAYSNEYGQIKTVSFKIENR